MLLELELLRRLVAYVNTVIVLAIRFPHPQRVLFGSRLRVELAPTLTLIVEGGSLAEACYVVRNQGYVEALALATPFSLSRRSTGRDAHGRVWNEWSHIVEAIEANLYF